MHPPARRAVPEGMGMVGNGGTPLVGPLWAVVDERRQAATRAGKHQGLLISGAMPRLARPGCLPLRRSRVWLWHRGRAPGDLPARHRTVIPSGDVCASWRLYVSGI